MINVTAADTFAEEDAVVVEVVDADVAVAAVFGVLVAPVLQADAAVELGVFRDHLCLLRLPPHLRLLTLNITSLTPLIFFFPRLFFFQNPIQ